MQYTSENDNMSLPVDGIEIGSFVKHPEFHDKGIEMF